MRMTTKLAGASLAALLAGCSLFSSKPKTNLPVPLVELKGSMAVRTAWKLDMGKSLNAEFMPAVVDNTVVLAGGEGALARVESASGKLLWRVKTDMPLTAGVGSDGKMIVVGGAKGVVLAYDMNGKQLWKAQASSEVLSSPVVGEGIVVVRSVDNRIVGLDAASGAQKWTVQRVAPPLTLRFSPGMTVVGKDVIVAQPGGKLLDMVLATGAPKWEVAVGEARGATELERVTDIGGSPVLYDKDVCAASYQGRVACFDIVTGSMRWSKELSSEVGVSVDERFVFAVDEKGDVSAFSRDGGTSAWRNDKLLYRRPSTPVSYGRAVAVGDFQGYIHFLSREDGKFLARMATDGSAVVGTPVVAGSTLIFQTQNGTVTAVATE